MQRLLASAVVGLVTAAGAAVVAQGSAGAAAAPVRIVKVQYDSPGADTRSTASINAEWVALRNVTGAKVNLSGWTLRDAQNHVYTFGNLTVAARATVYVHTGKGTGTAAHRYWGSGNYVWNNTGDTAILRSRTGVVQTCTWKKAAPGSISC